MFCTENHVFLTWYALPHTNQYIILLCRIHAIPSKIIFGTWPYPIGVEDWKQLFVQIWTLHSVLSKRLFDPLGMVMSWVNVGYQVPKSFFVRNCMKYPDLHRKIMYGTPLPLCWGRGCSHFPKCLLLWIQWSVQIFTKSHISKPPWDGVEVWGQVQKHFLCYELHETSRSVENCVFFGKFAPSSTPAQGSVVPYIFLLCRPGHFMQFLEEIILLLDPIPFGMKGWKCEIFYIHGHSI